MSIPAFIALQPADRQVLLTQLHDIILTYDKTVTAEIAPMMGKEMIIYNASGSFKYALASVKKHMSLHLLPMYMSPPIHEKYKALLPDASFQKGCINFLNSTQIPINTIQDLIVDCSTIDVIAMREKQLKAKKK